MTESIGITGAPFNTQIPTLAENANIQDALRVYHYGTATSNPGPNPPTNSIAGHLKRLDEEQFKKAVVTNVTATNLNDVAYQATGYYRITTTTSNGNYPTFVFNDADTTAARYPGLLQVVVDGPTIYQTYVAQIPSTPDKKVAVAIRSFYGTPTGSWSAWRQLLDDTWNYDNRYYVKGNAYNREQVDGFVTNLEQGKISAGTGTGANSLPQKIFVQENAPTTGMVAGDLWFW